MARDSITEKLANELERFPIRRESQVVYLLAEIRKIIEYEREQDPKCYEILEMFCHWALHTIISRKSNADRIRLFLKAFDMRDGMEIADYLGSSFLNEIMQLDAFRKDLKEFLNDHQLPCHIVHGFRSWSGFIYLYTSVVSEVPLIYSKGDLLPEEVEELLITHVPQPSGGQKMVRWSMKLQGGQQRIATTLYGVYRDQNNNVIGPPDFFLDEGFQL